MSQKQLSDDDQRFSTTSLLKDVEASDLSLEEIMSEFGGQTVRPAPLQAGAKPRVEGSRTSAYAGADEIWASLEAEIQSDIAADKAKRKAAEQAAAQPQRSSRKSGSAASKQAASAAPEQAASATQKQSASAASKQPASTAPKQAARGTGPASPSSAGASGTDSATGTPAQKETAAGSRFQFVSLDVNAPGKQKTGSQAEQQTRTGSQAAAGADRSSGAGRTVSEPARKPEAKPAQRTQAPVSPPPAPETPLPASPTPQQTPPGQPYGSSSRSSRVIYPTDPAPSPDASPAPEPESGRGARSGRKAGKKTDPAMLQPEPSVSSALRSCGKSLKAIRARLMPAVVLSILAGLLTLAAAAGWTFLSIFETPSNRSLVLVVIQALTFLLCYDVVIQGIYDLFHLRFTMAGLSLLAGCLILVEALANLADATPPFCAVSCFSLTLTLHGSSQKKLAMRRSLKALAASETPTDVRCVQDLREDGPCLVRGPGVQEGFINDMNRTDLADTVLGVYGPLLLAVTLVATVLLQSRLDYSFLWIWCALISAGLPLAGAVCFGHPWSLTAGRLLRSGAALSGWHGVQTLCSAGAVTIVDEDLYPEGSVQLSGMKLFSSFRADLVVGYAASLILPLGGSLAAPFRALQQEQGAQLFEATGLRAFEGGGIGGDIRGDVVLAGSMSFMQLMGVRLPRGTNVRQAVYVSINGELAGLFAVTYQKSRGVQKALRAITAEPTFQALFAIRDFLMSPALLRQMFGLPATGLEYPGVEARLALSRTPDPDTGERGAILSRNTLQACAETVCGAAHLQRTTRRNLLLAILGGVLGASLTAAALLLGYRQGLLPLLSLLYGLVWFVILSISSLLTLRY